MLEWGPRPAHRRKCMRKLKLLPLAVFVLMSVPIAFAGSDVPDLKGTWVMETKSIRHHKTEEPNPNKHHDVNTGLAQFKISITIDKQEGFRFSGTMESAKRKERISGVIGFDNKTLYIVDDDGMAFARLVGPNKIEHVYLHVTKHDSVAGRGVLVRKP